MIPETWAKSFVNIGSITAKILLKLSLCGVGGGVVHKESIKKNVPKSGTFFSMLP